MKGLDFIDTMSVFLFIGSVTTVPPAGVIVGLLVVLLAFARRSSAFQTLLLGEEVQRNVVTNWLLPPPKQLSAPRMTESEDTKPILTPVFSPPAQNDPFAIDISVENKDVSLKEALIRLPNSVNLGEYGLLESATAVPLGADTNDGMTWLDFATDTLHVGLYGQSGCGKDNLLRVWFALLCKRNSPQEIQFAVIDGKGDWLVQYMSELRHMFIAPAGGYGKVGDDAIRAAIRAIDKEAEIRQSLITSAGVRTREQYIKATNKAMPLLVVMATDVMTNVAGEVETLLNNLVSKARALGIRVIVSMQTPTDKDTKWRTNLSTSIAGNLNLPSQDTPALGLAVGEMIYRPSKLPSPQDRPGVFIVRRGTDQLLVQAPYIDEDKFDLLCKQFPRKNNISDGAVLSSLLNATIQQDSTGKSDFTIPTNSTALMPNMPKSKNEKVLLEIRNRLQRGESKTRIVREMWNVEGGKMFNLYGSIVDKMRAAL